MCLSALGQIVFGAVMLVTLGLTLGAMFTPGWNQLKSDVDKTVDNAKNNQELTWNTGIFAIGCRLPNQTASSTNSDQNNIDYCKEWWKNLKTWEKVVVGAMCLAVAIEIIALVWNFVTFCACCCKKYIIHPLSLFAVLLAIVLAIAVIVFGVHHKSQLNGYVPDSYRDKGEVGYSFYLACGALAGAVIDIFVASLTVCLAKHCL